MTDGSLDIRITYMAEAEVEFEIEEEAIEADWDYEEYHDEITGVISYNPIHYAKVSESTKYLYPNLEVTVGATVRDEKVQSYEILDWYIQGEWIHD
jgi:hypothetical protein